MRNIERALLGALLLVLAGACARESPPAARGPAPAAAATLCARQLLRREELDGILTRPLVAEQPVPGDPQSCRYTTDGFPGITVTARAGAGRATLASWRQGRVPLAASAVAGVGEDALWQDSLHELIAEQRDLLCDVQVNGVAADLAVPPDALPARLGQVCQSIFSRAAAGPYTERHG